MTSNLIDYPLDDPPSLPELPAEFWAGYLIALAFTATVDDPEGRGDPAFSAPGCDIRDAVTADDVEAILIAIGKRDELRYDCADFYRSAAPLLVDWNLDDAGQDFHLSRNGHGAGYFDRPDRNGYRLHELAKQWGTAELWRSADDPNDWMILN